MLKGDMKQEKVLYHKLKQITFYLKLVATSKVRLFESSGLNKLTGTMMILNTCTTHYCTNGFVDELLSLLGNSILLKPNNLPKLHYEARNLIQNLGLGYVSIHLCQNGCVLYQNEHGIVDICPICGEFQYVVRQNKVLRRC